jgi:uncharacterized membrane protein YgcG
MMMNLSKSEGDSALKPQHRALVVNMCVPLVIFLDESTSGGGSGGSGGGSSSGGGASRSSGGGKQSELSPAAAASRRYLCTSLITECLRRENLLGTEMFIHLCYAFGTMLGLSVGAAADLLMGAEEPSSERAKAPAASALLHYHTSTNPDGKRKVEDWVPLDPFLGPLYRRDCCVSCGLLPGHSSKQFQVCSLCKDPAAGQFCCKDPCFAAFWRGGHRDTCAGRDKLKKKKRKGTGGGGSDGGGAGQSSGATGTSEG